MRSFFMSSYRQKSRLTEANNDTSNTRKKPFFGWFCMLLVSVLMFSSCLKGEDDNVTYYSDTAITSFSLGTFNCYLHTTSSAGADSIYKKTITGTNYKFYIDQQKYEIYNPDSLPYGTDAVHIVCDVLTKNSGMVLLKNLTSDSLRVFASTDSIDFSKPRVLRVMANDGNAWRDYTVNVNVHQQAEDEFSWQLMMSGEKNLATTSRLRLATAGNRVFAFGLSSDGKNTFMLDLQQRLNDGDDSNSAINLIGDVTGFIASRANELLVLEGTQLHRFFDEAGSLKHIIDNDRNTTGISRLLGADEEHIYALAADGSIRVTTDNCLTWTEEQFDNAASLLPTEDLSCIVIPSKVNADVHRMLLIGNHSEETFPADKYALTWGKAVEPDRATEWYYIDQNESGFPLPRLRSLSAIRYGNLILAIGGSGFGGSRINPFSTVYASEDGGINWRDNARYKLPADFECNDVFAMTADAQNFIWMVCGQSGQIWRGRLTQMGWATEQKAYTK